MSFDFEIYITNYKDFIEPLKTDLTIRERWWDSYEDEWARLIHQLKGRFWKDKSLEENYRRYVEHCQAFAELRSAYHQMNIEPDFVTFEEYQQLNQGN